MLSLYYNCHSSSEKQHEHSSPIPSRQFFSLRLFDLFVQMECQTRLRVRDIWYTVGILDMHNVFCIVSKTSKYLARAAECAALDLTVYLDVPVKNSHATHLDMCQKLLSPTDKDVCFPNAYDIFRSNLTWRPDCLSVRVEIFNTK